MMYALIVIPTSPNTFTTLSIPIGDSLRVVEGKLEAVVSGSDVVHQGSATMVVGETPTGPVDDTNTNFVLAGTPLLNSLRVYRNGIRQKSGVDYSTSGTGLHFFEAPWGDDLIMVDYEK